jgi:uncharacterized HhH-GPD family protein
MAAATKPDRLYYTADDEANRLLAEDPLALLIGFALDQQVPVQKAFSAPQELRRRIGPYDAARITAMDPGQLDDAFRDKPALHRFPGAMAQRVQELCAVVTHEYGGRAERIWTEAADTADLRRRIGDLPGFGDMKVRALGSVLAYRFGLEAARELAPDHACLGEVDSPEALLEYQAKKRAHKASLRTR